MSAPVLNLPLAEAVLEQITTHPETHLQDFFGFRKACNTTHCIAGWAAVLSPGIELVWVKADQDDRVDILNGVLFPDREAMVDTPVAAEELLGLSDKQADELFYEYDDTIAIRRFKSLIENARLASSAKNVPASAPPRAGTTASTHIPPEGARTGAAGQVLSGTLPGRSTLTAPVGAGAVPIGGTSDIPLDAAPGGYVRTGAAGLVEGEPGRSTLDYWCEAHGLDRGLCACPNYGDLFLEEEPIGHCGHPIELNDWWAGHRTCDRCVKRDELLHAELGHAGLSLVIPALFAAALLLIAGASGKLHYLVTHLPLTERPNGFVLLVILLCGGVVAAHWLLNTADVLPAIDPDQGGEGGNVTELPGPWFATAAVEHPDPRWDKRLATEEDR